MNVDLEKNYDDVREEKGNVYYDDLLKKCDDDLEGEDYDDLREEEQDVDCDDLKNDNDDLEEYHDYLKEELENYDNDDLKKDNYPAIQSSIINEMDEEYLEWAIISLFDDNDANL